MNQPVWKRLMWMVIIWGGSVLALALVGMFFRVLMTAAGVQVALIRAAESQYEPPVSPHPNPLPHRGEGTVRCAIHRQNLKQPFRAFEGPGIYIAELSA
ncbi:Protein of uncharacterised function (DUF2474) [Leclercia adecarboxylata]|uniref:Protein of uncharacterized function (DUF2474) n=1 Tax=Leclercia adecarboxylata TaxID=83655 RepID=A0A4U9HXN1_9ENTR|nr:Protein of uncharacterised function (DUF2474) [Leclercia adecarboxylata]